MKDSTNTIFGWVLGAGIVALGLSAVSERVFEADSPELPEHGGYPVEAAETEGAGDTGPSFQTLLASSDVAAGEKIFAKCTSCHTITPGGPNGIGPNLYGTVGEAIGQGKAGFAFSSALSGHGGQWTFDNLNEWLKSPKAFAAGTKMSFAGLSSTEDRANVIAYLNAQGSNLPLPQPEATPTDGESGGVSGAPVKDNAGGDGAGAGVTKPGSEPGTVAGQSGQAAAGAMAQPAPKTAAGDKAVGSAGDARTN